MGVVAGLVVLIMSVTGLLLTYEREITSWADTRNYQAVLPEAGASRLPVETLLARARESRPDKVPSTFTMRADQTEPAAIGFTGGGTVFINPYTGEVLGEGSQSLRDFFRLIEDWHRWLGASGENRAVGRAITGACNFGFLFLVVSGFYLWWPRKWNWSNLRKVIWFRRGVGGKARDFNWHNVIGLWSVVPLFIIVLSGVVMSYGWANNLVYRIAGEAPPAPRGAPGQPPPNAGQGAREHRDVEVSFEGLNPLWSRAEQQVPDWQIISLRLPTSMDAPVAFSIDQGDGGQPQKRGQLTLERNNPAAARWEPFSSNTPGRRLRSFLRFAHTGEVAGLVGQSIAGLASAGAVFLVWTGLALAWRRLRAWLARKSGSGGYVDSGIAEGAAEEAGRASEEYSGTL